MPIASERRIPVAGIWNRGEEEVHRAEDRPAAGRQASGLRLAVIGRIFRLQYAPRMLYRDQRDRLSRACSLTA